MEWYRQVQFISAVAMPPDMAEEFGTTVNGMWAAPENLSAEEVESAHRAGRRALFSVPLIALVPRVYEQADDAHLLDETCRDIDGEPSECDWYYWESKPVYAACIYSEAFRRYLMDRCKEGVDRGYDVVNLDEIMTSVGLMDRDPGGCGFCARCLGRFRSHVSSGEEDPELSMADDDVLRKAIKTDDDLYERYRRFQQREAFEVMIAYIEELRARALSVNPAFAISANVAYLGNHLSDFGALWGCLWGPHIDFVMMENDYRIAHGDPHTILPRGKFTAWYRLGAAFNRAPNWICPSINVPRQFQGEDRRRYYELMFFEAYANGGRWGYFWGPGVDPEARRRASAPDALKDYIRFIGDHRELYEEATSMNELAILYVDKPIMRRPETHLKYLGLTQALAESGFQFDVLYAGDGMFNTDALDTATLARYGALLVPEARDLGSAPTSALQGFARAGGELVVFSESPIDPSVVRREDGDVLFEFWRAYRDADRTAIASTVGRDSSRIQISIAAVNAIRYALGERQIVHLLDYAYDAAADSIEPARDVRLSLPWSGGVATCTLLAPGVDRRQLPAHIAEDRLVVEIPEVDPYAVVVLEP